MEDEKNFVLVTIVQQIVIGCFEWVHWITLMRDLMYFSHGLGKMCDEILYYGKPDNPMSFGAVWQ